MTRNIFHRTPSPLDEQPERLALSLPGTFRVIKNVPTPACADAFEQGWRARMDLQRRGQRPYPWGSPEMGQWHNGWDWANRFEREREAEMRRWGAA